MTGPPQTAFKVRQARAMYERLAAEAALTPGEREATAQDKAQAEDKKARQLIARQARAARKANPALEGTAFLAEVAKRLRTEAAVGALPILTVLLETYPPVVALAIPLAVDEEAGG